ncbi:hypothetical protein SLI_2615 [Streptomyces lividans 1326]|uniref:Uncharacterized protein n=1 Tax=Streptomyces lividans 1326 TaxID=1200984 RepID=A0A7U9DS18_STRLI|nr:hypothetical protein SLI_2615 [Streptomyces lividans 1326]
MAAHLPTVARARRPGPSPGAVRVVAGDGGRDARWRGRGAGVTLPP